MAPSRPRTGAHVTLSNENAPSRSRAYPHSHPAPYGPQRVAYGPDTRSSGRGASDAGPYASHWRTPRPGRPGYRWSYPSGGQSAAKTAADWPPSGGVERPRRKERFARLIDRRDRVLGGPAVRAAFGGNLSLPWL
jgi:hypothetical protein